MSKLFNINNTGNRTGSYPLFFGEPLGLFDSFNTKYPEIKKADEEQRALFWKANEINFTRDYYDIQNASQAERDLIDENLSFQMAGDSFANSAIQMLFLPIITNPEATSLVSYWGDTESVHAETYGRIVAQCYEDPNEIFEKIKNNEALLSRLGFIQKNFDDHMKMVVKWLSGELVEVGSEEIKTVIRTVTTLLCLEGIMFLTSFSATFGVTEATQNYNGISKAVGLIHNDEAGMHVRNNLLFLDALKSEHPKEFEEMLPEMKALFDQTVRSEFKWADHLFEKVGSLVGYNANLYKEYTRYISRPLYVKYGLNFDFEEVSENPFPWIEKYINPDLLQVAQQEAQSQNYLVNASVDDSADEEFEY